MEEKTKYWSSRAAKPRSVERWKVRICHSHIIRNPLQLMLSVDFEKVAKSEEIVVKGGEERVCIHENSWGRHDSGSRTKVYTDTYVSLTVDQPLTPARLRVLAKDGLLTWGKAEQVFRCRYPITFSPRWIRCEADTFSLFSSLWPRLKYQGADSPALDGLAHYPCGIFLNLARFAWQRVWCDCEAIPQRGTFNSGACRALESLRNLPFVKGIRIQRMTRRGMWFGIRYVSCKLN